MNLINGEKATAAQEREHNDLLINGNFEIQEVHDVTSEGNIIPGQISIWKKTTASDGSVVCHE